MTDLTLPGDIPGLLRRGSPVLNEHAHGVVTDPAPDDAGYICVAGWWGNSTHPADVALDLADATGRAHAAWWLALWWQEHRGAGPTLYPLLGTVWHRCGDTSWRLSWCYTDTTWGISVPAAPSYVEVPSLAEMSAHAPDDPRTLPDGSRWMDAEALRRAVLHAALEAP